MNYDEEERNIDQFESEIDELIAEVIRKTKNQEHLQKEIEFNQKKLEEIKSKSAYSINSRGYDKYKLHSIAENDSENEYSCNNEPTTYSKLTLSDISDLIKTATDINNQSSNVDIEFIKNFFQSEINNCIQNSDSDIDLQDSLNKMLQDFLNCLQTNLNELKKTKLNESYSSKHERTKSPFENSLCNTSITTNITCSKLNKLSDEQSNKYWSKHKHDLDPETQEKEVEIVFQNIYRSHKLTHVSWDDQEEEEIDEEREKNQQIKVYSTWSENILSEKNAHQQKKIKCEFIPKQVSGSTTTTNSKISNTTPTKHRNSTKLEEDTSNKKSHSKSKIKTSTQPAAYDIAKNLRNSIGYNTSKVNFPLQGGNNKSQNKFNRSLSNRISDVYSGKLSKNSSSLSSNQKSGYHHQHHQHHQHHHHHHHHHKDSNSGNNNSNNSSRKTSANASVTNISEILHEISTGKSFEAASSMMLPSQLNHRTANSNVIKKFIHKIKTIV